LDLANDRAGELKPLSALRGTRVLAVSGIARPASFRTMLKALGALVSGECIYPDHYEYKRADLVAIFKKAADDGVSMIVTTEKDAVRLRSFRPEGIWALRIELAIAEYDEWEAFILKSL
jgi:tetraacyldisaccharide-1-P 4'-kinase